MSNVSTLTRRATIGRVFSLSRSFRREEEDRSTSHCCSLSEPHFSSPRTCTAGAARCLPSPRLRAELLSGALSHVPVAFDVRRKTVRLRFDVRFQSPFSAPLAYATLISVRIVHACDNISATVRFQDIVSSQYQDILSRGSARKAYFREEKACL